MSNYFNKETVAKSCKVTIRDYNNRIIVSYPSLFPKQAVEDAKKIASYYRAASAFQPISWEVEIATGNNARTLIWDVIK